MAEDLVKRLRVFLAGIASEEMGGDNLSILLASYFEPGVEDDELDDSGTWKQGAIDASNHVLDAIHAHYAALIEQQAASLAAKDAEIERLRAVDTRTSLLTVIADIREKSSVGGKPMLDELADEIAGKIAAAESRAEQAERAFNREQDNIYASFDKWSKALGWGLTGNQPECWALMDSAVEELVGKRTALAEARTELGETQLVLEQTERNAARVIAEAITVIQQGESATNAAYCQAMAEYHGHDKTADKHDRTVTAFRHAARAFVAQHGSDSREGK